MRAAVVGPGRVAGEHIKAYQQVEVQVVGIAGRTRESAQKKIAELNLAARAYGNLREMLAAEKPDVLSICSPPELHAEHFITAAEMGVHCVIEKPVAVDEEQLAAMLSALRSNPVKTIVSFVLRWNDFVLNIKKHLDLLGELVHFEVEYCHGPWHKKPHREHEYGTRVHPIGAMLGGGCHAVDMVGFLVESPIMRVQALTPNSRQPQRTTLAIARCENGLTGKILATDEVFGPYAFNIRLMGRQGRLEGRYIYSDRLADNLLIPGDPPASGAVTHHPFSPMIAEFVNCVGRGVETSCSLASVANVHQVCFKAEEKARYSLGGVVVAPPDDGPCVFTGD